MSSARKFCSNTSNLKLKPFEILRCGINETPTHCAHRYGLSLKPEIRVTKEGDTNMKNGIRYAWHLDINKFCLTNNKFSVFS